MAERGQESSLGLFIYLFTFGCTGSLMLFAWAFSSSGEWGLLSTCGAWASHCSGFSCCEAQVLGHSGFSRCSSQALEHRPCSSGARACSSVSGIFTGQGLNLCLLAGEFLTTEPTVKSPEHYFCSYVSTDSQSKGAMKMPLNERQTIKREEVFVCFPQAASTPLTMYQMVS